MIFSNTVFVSLSIITAALYLSSAGIIASTVFLKKRVGNLRTFFLISAFASIATHAALVVHSYNVNNVLAHDFFNMLSLVFLVISILFFLTTLRKPIETLGVIVFPFSTIAVLFNANNAFPNLTVTALDPALQTHIILSVLSYSLLSVAAFQAVFLSIQEKQLHNRQTGSLINSLPPLQLMEDLLFQTIAFGVFLLTFALISGFIFIDDIFAQHLVHKTVLSIVAWVIFSTLLWGRHYIGWRGQTAIKWTYGGYISLMLAYFGSKFVLQLVL
jgi:ABC-type uncharacterized transport system permease subunit